MIKDYVVRLSSRVKSFWGSKSLLETMRQDSFIIKQMNECRRITWNDSCNLVQKDLLFDIVPTNTLYSFTSSSSSVETSHDESTRWDTEKENDKWCRNSFRAPLKCENRNKFNAENFFLSCRISFRGDEIYLWISSTAEKPFHLSFPQNLNNRT